MEKESREVYFNKMARLAKSLASSLDFICTTNNDLWNLF